MSSGFLLNGSTGFVGGAIARLAHAADERIPVEALDFGTEAIYKVLQRFGG